MLKRLAIIVAMLLTAGIAFAEPTWEGELNPNNFDPPEWVLVKSARISNTTGVIILDNADQSQPIKRVELTVFISTNTLLQYRYFKGEESFTYYLDPEKNRYTLWRMTLEEQEACANCHSNMVPRADL